MTKTNFLRALLTVFLIKFAFALFPSFQVDMGAWLAWADRLVALGPARFYSDIVWTQYTPGFLYWLWFIGKIGLVNPLMIKIPVIIADMITGYLIWRVVSKVNIRWANFSYLLYVLNPVTIFDGSVWGQIDGLLTLMMFLSTYLLLEKKNCYLSFVVAGLAILVKPQAIAVLPVLSILTLAKFGITKTISSSFMGALVVILGFYPFYPTNPIEGMIVLIKKMGVSYPYTSVNAFNLWSYLGMWKPDNMGWMGITYFMWGTIAMGIAFVILLFKYRRSLAQGHKTYLIFALSCFIFFLFPTRVHERYLFPMFAYLVTFTGLTKQKSLFILTIFTSLIYLINLYYPYSYYEQLFNPLKNINLENLIYQLIPVIAIVQTIIFTVLLFWNDLTTLINNYFHVGKTANKVSQ